MKPGRLVLGYAEAVGEMFPEAKCRRCVVLSYQNVFSVVHNPIMKHMVKMFKAIYARENKKATRRKSTAVVTELKSIKLPEAAKDGERIAAGFSLAHRTDVRPKFKYQVIYRHRSEYPVSVMCQFFGVSRSGYYSYVKRLGQIEKDVPLAEKIKAH